MSNAMRRETTQAAFWWGLLLCAVIAVSLRASASTSASADTTRRGPVLIELFTSQGCSSCPPADRLLSRLGQDPELGDAVIPLAFHVDYWNRLGWKDPFSAPAWSERQRDYASRIPGESVYTPQLVIDGRFACIGSSERRARSLIRAARMHPVEATLRIEDPSPVADGIDLNVRVDLKQSSREAPILYAAAFTNGETTQVTAGENAKRTLHDDFVVQSLSRLATVRRTGSHRVHAVVELPADARTNISGIAVFLQDPATRHVLAADRIRLDNP